MNSLITRYEKEGYEYLGLVREFSYSSELQLKEEYDDLFVSMDLYLFGKPKTKEERNE